MITEKIVEWLEQHGYPLEMYVASVFQNLGFKVDQGIYFSDPETGSSREVDIVAYKSFNINGMYVSFACVIECKSSREKPWLLFKDISARNIDSSMITFSMTNGGKKLLNKLEIGSKRNDDLFPITFSNYGYAMTQALRKSDSIDNTFKAVYTLSKAIEDFTTKYSSNEFIYYYFPLIAMDSQLFEVTLKNSGGFNIEKVYRASYLGRAPRPGNAYFYIDLITKENVVHFAEEFSKRVESFISRYSNQIFP